MTPPKLSLREREILVLAAQGQTDKEIARELGISVRTVGTHWERLKEKTGANSRTQMVMEVLGSELRLAARLAIEAKAERDTILEQAEGLAFFSVNPRGKIMDWNSGIARILGFEREEFVGKDLTSIFPTEDVRKQTMVAGLEHAREHGRFLDSRYHRHKCGELIWLQSTLVAIYEDAKTVRRYSMILRDDSPRKLLEEEILRLQNVEASLAHRSIAV